MRFPLLTVLSGASIAVLVAACSVSPDRETPAVPAEIDQEPPHPYVGMWVTADGHIRQELLANGRYDEARGRRKSAYTGSYQVFGTRIEYVDDTGFTADGTFDADILHHGGDVFYREGSDAHRRSSGS
ncbi:Atu4866 domain-containing protein [Actinoplanes cyaneus]|nr:Atu4866 domain-containing protein [Actinoplanes cyaneus]MCW2136948.1 protein Atu4866 [Actinoplanes cyaneus]